MRVIDPDKFITDAVLFNGATNVQFSGEFLKIYNPKLTIMRRFKHTVYFFFNNVSKIPIVNQMILDHKAIYNIFGYIIYHEPHFIFKSKLYEFHNRNIGLFSGNDNRISPKKFFKSIFRLCSVFLLF